MASRAARIALDMALGATQSLKQAGSSAWPYLKVEAVPPMTLSFFDGPAGKRLEDFAEKTANGVIQGITGKIKSIEAEAARVAKEKEAAIKAQLEKQKAEAEKAEIERKKAAAEKAALAAKEAKAKAEKAEQDKKAKAAAKPKEAKAEKGKDKPKDKPKQKPKKKTKSPKRRGRGKPKTKK